MTRHLLPLLLLAALAGPLHAQRPPAAAHERDRISPEEVRGSTAADAFQLVQSLRSFWFARREGRLATRLAPSPRRDPEGPLAQESSPAVQNAPRDEGEGADGLIVLLDGTLLGGRESLREIPIDRVLSVDFLSPEQARTRLGRRARDGAIVVHTRGGADR